MAENVRESSCSSCMHREVCKHKENYLKACKAVFNANYNEAYENGIRSVPISNFECILRIDVRCKYYLEQPITFPKLI